MRRNVVRKFLDAFFGWLIMGILALYGTVRGLIVRRYRTPLAELDVKSVLVIKLCCLGDGVLAIPAIRALKKAYPHAKLRLMCTARNIAAFEELDFIDDVVNLHLTGLGGIKELVLAGPGQFVKALGAVRGCQPDIAVDLDLYYKLTPILSFVSGAPVRAGFDTAGANRGWLYTHKAPRERNKHELLCFLDILGSLGIYTEERDLLVWCDPQAAKDVVQMLAENGITAQSGYAVLAPGSSKNWPVKRWAADRFVAVGKYLHEKLGLDVVITGADFERTLGLQIAEGIGAGAVDLVGRTSIRQTIELLRGGAVLISNDSGPMHLAAAVKTPVVGIFGPTNPRKWRPWGQRVAVVTAQDVCEQAPCYYLSSMRWCDAANCLGKITVEQVTAAIDEVLSQP